MYALSLIFMLLFPLKFPISSCPYYLSMQDALVGQQEEQPEINQKDFAKQMKKIFDALKKADKKGTLNVFELIKEWEKFIKTYEGSSMVGDEGKTMLGYAHERLDHWKKEGEKITKKYTPMLHEIDVLEKQHSEEIDPDIIPENQLENLPKAMKRVPADYPDSLRKSGIIGRVVLKMIIDADGQLTKIIILKEDDPAFNKAAIEAAKQWQFTPGKSKGKPVKTSVTVTFDFNLR